MSEAAQRIGLLFRVRRKQLGLTQAQHSDMTGISRTHIIALEAGRAVTLAMALELALELEREIVAVPRDSAEANQARAVRNAWAHGR
ncbi:helix-turn-helix transcriptional regulator [Galactobacter valiniphilus]|uniref:helix-turn-helix transcriptional regulator n=1 Tax=Galactobacter valiniphilus TaxID=2676122 RepID=UPI003734D15C